MHALLDAVVGARRDAEQFDAEAEFVGGGEVGERDRLDAFDADRIGIEPHAEGQRRQDRKLVRGVEAADVEGRVGLGVAESLRLLEARLERQPLGLHLRQDVVAGAVEDAADARDAVAGERLAQRLDDGDAAADRGLEGERRAAALGEFGKFLAMRGEHRLVGGDDGDAARQSRLDRRKATPSAPPISSTNTSMSACAAISAASAKNAAPSSGRPRAPAARAL